MKILVCSRHRVAEGKNVEQVGFEVLLDGSDVISLHVPLNEETRHLITRDEMHRINRNALLVNTSRGGVIDEMALIEALTHGKIAGAALDVFKHAPLPADSPLRDLGNVILTPHTAGMPEGPHLHRKRYKYFVENIRRIEDG